MGSSSTAIIKNGNNELIQKKNLNNGTDNDSNRKKQVIKEKALNPFRIRNGNIVIIRQNKCINIKDSFVCEKEIISDNDYKGDDERNNRDEEKKKNKESNNNVLSNNKQNGINIDGNKRIKKEIKKLSVKYS